MSEENDKILEIAKKTNIVPVGCILSGAIILSEVMRNIRPCDRCNIDRKQCGGLPKIVQKKMQRIAKNSSKKSDYLFIFDEAKAVKAND